MAPIYLEASTKHVFLRWHSRDLGDGETNDKLIGVGFRDAPEGFLIDRYQLDRDAWSERYITV
jgi:hypothetical protein